MRPDSWPSVSDHPAEQLYREAAEAGHQLVWWLQRSTRRGDPFTDVREDFAIAWAIKAAGLYHEAQRLSGICPEHGTGWPCEKEGCA